MSNSASRRAARPAARCGPIFRDVKPGKRSLTIAGHRTSISIEDPFWHVFQTIAASRNMPLAALVAEIDGQRGLTSLSSAIRLYVLGVVSEGSKPGE